jgi:hypothetical protein
MLGRVRLIKNIEYIFLATPLIEYKGNTICLIQIVIQIEKAAEAYKNKCA